MFVITAVYVHTVQFLLISGNKAVYLYMEHYASEWEEENRRDIHWYMKCNTK